MRPNQVVLSATGVSRTFQDAGSPVEVLRGLSIDVRRAEVVAILGASGVGKSTLLHILGALDRPDGGTVEVGGADIHALRGRELDELRNGVIGFVFQFHFLLPEFTALENVMLPALMSGSSPQQAAGRAAGWLDRVGLSNRNGHRPGELSGGEQQRVAVARALVNDPQIVLADEPTGNLDDGTSEEVHRLVRRLAHDGVTFVVVTHKRNLAEHADRVLVLENGRLRTWENSDGGTV